MTFDEVIKKVEKEIEANRAGSSCCQPPCELCRKSLLIANVEQWILDDLKEAQASAHRGNNTKERTI